jgi:hypothetical protein
MANQYRCKQTARLELVKENGTLNAIDYLEVLDHDAPAGSPPQRTLLVHLVLAPGGLTATNVQITGGVRITPVNVVWAFPATSVPSTVASAAERAYFSSLPDAAKVLVVRTDSDGDYSTYNLALVQSLADADPPAGFDPQLSAADFSFKVECPSDFDCRQVVACPTATPSEPRIDYLAKDYLSFRQLMLDRLSVTIPNWQERNPADLGVALVETMAYAADYLSYQQDAVATEAYLGTALKRTSVRRHARLLDYAMSDGSNSRVWVALNVGAGADGFVLKKSTQLLTRTSLNTVAIPSTKLDVALGDGALVFETMHDITLRQNHGEIQFHTWGDDQCCLPKNATSATLNNTGDHLSKLTGGDVLVFEEVRGASSGLTADADPSHRHAVRITSLRFTTDPLFTESPGQPLRIVEIEWRADDALPFPLCLWTVGGKPVSVARGNVVLADYGRTIENETLPAQPDTGRYRPVLDSGPLTQAASTFDPAASAASAFIWQASDVRPAITVIEQGHADQPYTVQRDLLNSGPFARDFVAEVDDSGRAQLRFGDGVLGVELPPGAQLLATYRVGNGTAGNIGADAIAHVVTSQDGFTGVRNPLPAEGGTDPEPIGNVKLYAPQAFRTEERAVTEADYAAVAGRHPEVQKAAATLRWTGSWYTVFVTVDRRGGRPVDAAFKSAMTSFLDHYRLAGYDVEIESPRFVSLDIALTICVMPGYLQSSVEVALTGAFSSANFFNPDNFTFGQPLYLSQLVATALSVPGVMAVDTTDKEPNRFQRQGSARQPMPPDGELRFDRLEIPQVLSDPSRPEGGRIQFSFEGGL